MRRTVKVLIGRYRSEVLMFSLVAEVVASPLADRRPHLGGFLALSVVLITLAGASYMADRRIIRLVALPIATLWLLARLLEAFGDSRHFYTHLAPFAGLAFSCAALWALLSRFHTISRVTRSVISEAFISYLIIAIAFSQLYSLLSKLPDSPFSQVIPASENSAFLFFSMTTLSGVGYGAMKLVNPYVRLLAALENMTGIFYVAVIVARLVSSYRSRVRPPVGRPHRSQQIL
jgi:voltage-gated potassium channel